MEYGCADCQKLDGQLKSLRADLRTVIEVIRYSARNCARNAKERSAIERISQFAKFSVPAREYHERDCKGTKRCANCFSLIGSCGGCTNASCDGTVVSGVVEE